MLDDIGKDGKTMLKTFGAVWVVGLVLYLCGIVGVVAACAWVVKRIWQ